jgi:hypothetical protein
MAFGTYDFTGARSVPVEDDWSFTLTWKAGASAATATPVDLTGYAASFTLWKQPGEQAFVAAFPCTLGGAAGTIALSLGHAALRALPQGLLYYTLVVTAPGGVRRTLLKGQFQTV